MRVIVNIVTFYISKEISDYKEGGMSLRCQHFVTVTDKAVRTGSLTSLSDLENETNSFMYLWNVTLNGH